jgi:septal ring factor EnvC (AmiA/AmiB activator)
MKNPRIAETLQPLKDQLEAERASLQEQLEPLQAARAALLAKLQPLEAELRAIDAQITAIEQPKMREIGNELAAIARQLGAVTLVNG